MGTGSEAGTTVSFVFRACCKIKSHLRVDALETICINTLRLFLKLIPDS